MSLAVIVWRKQLACRHRPPVHSVASLPCSRSNLQLEHLHPLWGALTTLEQADMPQTSSVRVSVSAPACAHQHPACRLTYLGYDFLAIHALVKQGAISSVGRQIGVGKESDVFEVGAQRLLCGRDRQDAAGQGKRRLVVLDGLTTLVVKMCFLVETTMTPSGQSVDNQACGRARQGSCSGEGEPHVKDASTCCIVHLCSRQLSKISCARHRGGPHWGGQRQRRPHGRSLSA